jgi:protein-S-isoprenylcysteine O-methyltransferase Ste14
VLLIASGAAFYLWCAWEFAAAGLGTPAPIDPPKVLVARGLYRVVRNPMYVGVLLVLLGESLVFGSWALLRYAVLVWLCFHLFVVLYEEPALRRKFGASYEGYRKRVWRWTPRLPPRGRTDRDAKSN